jgi:hypothetical protein
MNPLLSPALSRSLLARVTHVQRRAFHSPFAALTANVASSRTTTPQRTATATAPRHHGSDEKQVPDSNWPDLASARVHVVCPPDPANLSYSVPTGAYRVDAPYPTMSSTPQNVNPPSGKLA